MGTFVVDPTVVLHWLREGHGLPEQHEVLAPTLLRSQILDTLYRKVHSGQLAEADGLDQLAQFARMKIRYLGDKVLRRKAWSVASQLGWGSTGDAEYVALTILQADALVTLDETLAADARQFVAIANLHDLR